MHTALARPTTTGPAHAPPDGPRPTAALDLEIVIPVWNEEQRIGGTLAAITAHAATTGLRVSVTVVDNGSVDRTADVVDKISRRPTPGVDVRLLGCSRQGKGAAVRRGVLASRATWVGFCDADLATPPEALDAVIAQLHDGAPVVIGSRRCEGASVAVRQPLGRRVGSAGFRLLTTPLAPGIRDTQCGFKFFTAEAAGEIFGRSVVDGFSFDVELLALATRLGYPVHEVPVQWMDQAGSSFRVWTDGRQVLRELRRARASLTAAA